MGLDFLIVGIILFAAISYVGFVAYKKVSSFTAESSCGGDCGCEVASKSSITRENNLSG